MSRFLYAPVLLLFLLLPSAGLASAIYVQPLGEAFHEEREAVQQGIASGRFPTLTPENRATVLRLLDEMARTLEGIEDLGQIEPEARNRLLNSEHHINQLLTGADPDQRVVCRRERTVGTHFRTQKCATVAEWRMITRGTRDKMERRRNPCLTHDGGRCTSGSDVAFGG